MKRTRTLPQLLAIFALGTCIAAVTSCGDDAPEKPLAIPAASQSSAGPDEKVYDQEPVVELGTERAVAGAMVYRLAQEPATLNPLRAVSPLADKLVRFHLNLKLLEQHPLELDAIPWLAASMPEKSEDGLVHTWAIKPSARWSDGKPVTAADFASTWNLLQSENPEVRAACIQVAGAHESIARVTAVDDKHFEVHYKLAVERAEFVFGQKFSPVPAHAVTDPLAAVKARHLTGCGPYRFKSWSDGVIHFERIDDWWGNEEESFKNRFLVKDFRYKVVADTVQVIEQLKSGALDFSVVGPREYAALMKEAETYNLEGTHYYLSQWSFIGFNCGDPLFSDKRVREAISLLIPRSQINQRHYEGLARPVSGPFFADSIFSSPKVKADRYDPLRAREILEQAGWYDRDKDGHLDKDGRKLSFVLHRTQAGLQWSSGLIEQIRDSLAQAGITMEIDTQAGSNLYGSVYPLAQHQAYAEVWQIDPIHPDADIQATFHSNQTGRNGFNWQQFRNPTLDLLINKMANAENDAVRIKSAREIHKLIKEQAPMAFLFNNPACVVWNRRIEGVVAYPLGVRQWDFRVKP